MMLPKIYIFNIPDDNLKYIISIIHFLNLYVFHIQTSELSQWQRRVSELNNKISELEENIARVQKDHCKSQEACAKLQRDLRENVAQKEDQVSRSLNHSIQTSNITMEISGGAHYNAGKALCECSTRVYIVA